MSFILKITGDNSSPENIRLSDLGDLMINFEKVIIPIVRNEEPSLPSENILISLAEIKNNCTSIRFKANHPYLVTSAFLCLAHAIVSNAFQSVPENSLYPFQEICKFCKKNQFNIELFKGNGEEGPLAVITPDLDIEEASISTIRGQTVIYGLLEKIGGTEPKAYIKSSNGKRVTARLSKEMARQVAKYIYSTVQLRGIAEWDITDGRIVSFEIEDMMEFKEIPLTTAFKELRESFGKYYDDIDVDEFMSEIRGDD